MTAAPAGLLHRSAEAFAAQGWHVIPTAGKVPRTEHGVEDATTDPAVIAQWWNRWPTAGIGVACGPSGLLVVDLDGPDATATWRDLTREHDLAPTRTARTGRPDGWHLYYRHPPAAASAPVGASGADLAALGMTTQPVNVAPPAGRVRNSNGQLAPDIDIRTAGGYVIAPPSLHESGTALYTWHVPAGATRPLPVSDAPVWLLDTLATPDASGPGAGGPVAPPPAMSQRYLDAAIAGEAGRVAAAVEGTRNHTLNRAAFALAGLGVPEPVIRERLTHAAQDAGLDAREIDRTLTSGISAGQLHPRSSVTITRPGTPTTTPPSTVEPVPEAQHSRDSPARPETTRGVPMNSTASVPDPTQPTPAPSHTGERTEAASDAEDGSGSDPVAQLRAWAARTGQGTTLPVERVAGFGANRAAALRDDHDRIEVADDQEPQVLVKPGAAQIAQMHADARSGAALGAGIGTTAPGPSESAEPSAGAGLDPRADRAPRVDQIHDVGSSPIAVGDADPTELADQVEQGRRASVVEDQGQRYAVRPFQRTHLDHLRAEYGALLAARDELVAASLHAASGRLSDSDRHQAQAIRHRADANRHADRAVADLAGLDPDDATGSRPPGRALGLTVKQARGWDDSADAGAAADDWFDTRDQTRSGGWDDGRADAEDLVSSGADDGWDRGL